MRRALAWTAAVLLVAAGAGYVGWRVHKRLGESAGGRRGGPPVVAVEVQPAQRTTLRDVGRFTGSLQADSRFLLAGQVGGRLEKLNVNIGDPVRRGEEIAVLADAEYVQQRDRAAAELAVAQANVIECQSNRDLAQRERERVTRLWNATPKIASDADLEQARAQAQVHEARCQVAAAQVAQKTAALKEAEVRLSYTRITAAWQGGAEVRYVGQRFVDDGALLTANEPIVSILDNSSVTAVVFVVERDYAKIRVGQLATVTTDKTGELKFTGRVARKAPELQEASRQGRVEIRIPNDELLLAPGTFARVELEFAAHADAQAVPVTALARREGRRGVFVVNLAKSRARFVPCTLGITDRIRRPGRGAGRPAEAAATAPDADESDPDNWVEMVEVIRPPLTEPVVVMGQHLLGDDSAVKVVEPTEAEGASAGPGGRGANR